MSQSTAARTTPRGILEPQTSGLNALSAVGLARRGYRGIASWAPALTDLLRGVHRPTTADGVLPRGVSVFDDRYAGVAHLHRDLLTALREAARDAAKDGVEFYVNSGWRSPDYQRRLFRKAVAKYGSEGEAARWVATAETSAHVSGEAADIGPFDATAWLSEHGAAYGLCQIYANEPWHYELRPEAAAHGRPPMYADPTHDPRMRR